MSPLELVLERLDRVRQCGANQWRARCPAHDDRNPSLSVSVGDGCALVHCHAGCTIEAICAAIGIGVRDLFVDAPGTGLDQAETKRQQQRWPTADDATRAARDAVRRQRGGSWHVTSTHSYVDATGAEVMRVLRFEPPGGGEKTYRPISREAGSWRLGDPEGPLPLYRRGTLADADVVYVAEGEKAADAAAALGLTCTTSAHGASAAGKTDWSPLAGKDLVLMADNDDAGRDYASDVTRLLLSLVPPARVRVVELPNLPEHGDIVEFIAARRAAGNDDAAIKTEIEQLVAAAPFAGSGGAPGDGPSRPSGGSVGAPGGSTLLAKVTNSLAELRASGGSVGGGRGPSLEFGEPEPLPNDMPPVDAFDPWMLPRAFFGWIVDIAERIQCPIDFPAVSAMVALASALGRKVGIRPKRHDDWLVVANLWGALIGRPGIMKTPPLQEATRPLKRLEIDAKKVFDDETADYEARVMVFEEKKKTIQKGIKKELSENDEKGALAIAEEVIDSEPEEPVRRRYLVNDSTVEKLGEILNENPNGVLVLRDELAGLLRNLDKEGQESARAFYLEAWNGTGRFTYDRIGRGTIDIEAATVSMLGSIQPGPLGQYLREAVQGGRGDDGLISRFQLAVWPDPSPDWKNVDRWPDTAAKNAAYGVFTWFDKLGAEDVGAERDVDDDDAIPFLRFDDRAQRVFDRWRGGLERRLRSGEEHPALESHFSKYRSLIPSLALLIHLADGGKGAVGLEPLRKAIAWGRYLSSHARRIYAVAVMDDMLAAKRLVARIRKGEVKDGFTERDVYRHDWSGLDRESVQKAVNVLVDYGWVVRQVEQTEGRPRTVVRINPRILKSPPQGTDKAAGSPVEEPSAPRESTDRTDGSSAEFSDARPNGTDGTDGSTSGDWGTL